MKKMILKSFISAVVFWFTFLFILYLGKARQSTDPNLWDNGTALYVNNNETLTSAKRNALVKKTNKKMIFCGRGGTTCPSTYWNLNFTAAECGGTLPDANYYAIPQAMQFWWFWQINAYDWANPVQVWCPNTTTAYYVRILYVEK